MHARTHATMLRAGRFTGSNCQTRAHCDRTESFSDSGVCTPFILKAGADRTPVTTVGALPAGEHVQSATTPITSGYPPRDGFYAVGETYRLTSLPIVAAGSVFADGKAFDASKVKYIVSASTSTANNDKGSSTANTANTTADADIADHVFINDKNGNM